MTALSPFRFRLTLTGVFFVVMALTIVLLRVVAHAAGDPSTTVTAASDTTWDMMTTDGPLWGTLLIASGLLRSFLNKQHWLAQGKILSGLTAVSLVLAAVGAWHFGGAPAGGILTALIAGYTLITHSTVPGAVPATSGPPTSTGAAILAVFLLGGLAVTQVNCAEVKPRTANAIGAFIDCQAPNLVPLLPDAVGLAKAAVMRWISGSGTVDAAGLKADAAPLKSDLGKCAWDAAIAALATPAQKPAPGAPAAAGLEIDGPALRARWAATRAELGWAPAVGL